MNAPIAHPLTRTEHLEGARGKTVRATIARVCGEADAAQYKPSGNHPSLTALAEHDREQRVFAAIKAAAETVARKRGFTSEPAPRAYRLGFYGLEKIS